MRLGGSAISGSCSVDRASSFFDHLEMRLQVTLIAPNPAEAGDEDIEIVTDLALRVERLP